MFNAFEPPWWSARFIAFSAAVPSWVVYQLSLLLSSMLESTNEKLRGRQRATATVARMDAMDVDRNHVRRGEGDDVLLCGDRRFDRLSLRGGRLDRRAAAWDVARPRLLDTGALRQIREILRRVVAGHERSAEHHHREDELLGVHVGETKFAPDLPGENRSEP
jgi:hypothetical protein